MITVLTAETGIFVLDGKHLQTHVEPILSPLYGFRENIPIHLVNTKNALEYLKWIKGLL